MKLANYFHIYFSKFFPKIYQKVIFRYVVGYWSNLNNPTKIREIIFRLKYFSTNKFKNHVDKSEVRKIVKRIIQKNNIELFLPELLHEAIPNENIDFTKLDEECFIKASSGSGTNILYVPGQSNLNEVRNTIKKWFNLKYDTLCGEKCYEGISQQVLVEKILKCSDGNIPDDIKVHCYFGIPEVVQIIRRRNGHLERKTYNSKWEEQKWFENEKLVIDINTLPTENVIIFSKILAHGFDYVRIDFYNVDGKLYFGEYTFFPASSHLPLISYDVDKYLGALYDKRKLEKNTIVAGNFAKKNLKKI